MPKTYIKEKNKDYCIARDAIVKNKKYIKNAFFSKKDKLFLNLFVSFPKLSKMIASKQGELTGK